MIEALVIGAEGFKLRVFAGNFPGRRLQGTELIEKRTVKARIDTSIRMALAR